MNNELSLAELEIVCGGARNSDDARVKAFLNAFHDSLEAGRAAATLELARSQGCLGPTFGKI
ncbi:hypothetical protein ACRQ5Q_26570 [Bradyrhizobium sp. PMVTL-01]|uniref:hypothetical protein n=1 Tax=unclassified Bradyrhizobium TaxID=2631580 RepID=UPI003F6E6115